MHYCFMSSARLGIWSFKVQRCNNLIWSNGSVSLPSSPENLTVPSSKASHIISEYDRNIGSSNRCVSHIRHTYTHTHTHTHGPDLIKKINNGNPSPNEKHVENGAVQRASCMFNPRCHFNHVYYLLFHFTFTFLCTTLMWCVIGRTSHWRSPRLRQTTDWRLAQCASGIRLDPTQLKTMEKERD